MSRFGRINSSDTSFGEVTFNKNQTLTSASDGVSLVHAIKDQTSENIPWKDGGALTTTGSHWAFVHNMFYMSGSTKVAEIMPADSEKFNSIYDNFNEYNDLVTRFNNVVAELPTIPPNDPVRLARVGAELISVLNDFSTLSFLRPDIVTD